MTEEAVFKPRARLILQLGEQLFRSEKVAILELVKNSYDADASVVKVEIKNVNNPTKGYILIEDNGEGMDYNIIKNVWMEPGSDYKEKQFKDNKKTTKYKRLPIGEKGIGRFGAHRCGNSIELISKKENQKEVYLNIDWNIFQTSEYLDKIPIIIEERDPVVFTGNKTGTRIIIKDLKTKWNRGKVRDLFRTLNSLCSPFEEYENFKINFEIDNEDWISGLLSWTDIRNYALFYFDCIIDGKFIKIFRYNFNPWPSMKKLSTREITEKDEEVIDFLELTNKDKNVIDLNKYRIGKVYFKGYIFDRDPKILSLGVQDKKGMRDFLNNNGGVRIYRDSIRIYDYGEPGNDWLGLDIKRINIPSKRISNNLIVGAINLSREQSSDLEEKTNREGFIENESYFVLRDSINYVLDRVIDLRWIDKIKLREEYGPNSKSEPVLTNIDNLRTTIENRIKDKTLKKDIIKEVNKIERDYKRINAILLRSAGAGLNLSIVIHEIEKIISELIKVVKVEKPSKRIYTLINHLSKLIERYSVIVRSSDMKSNDLKKVIKQALFAVEYRLKVHNIKVIKEFEKTNINTKKTCARELIISSILNIIDNSIWWLEHKKISKKKIYITISEEIPGFLSIILADNGLGFTLGTTVITEPFVTNKPYGMGLGLHITKEIMNSHKGEILFPDWKDLNLPDDYKTGAIVALAFRKE